VIVAFVLLLEGSAAKIAAGEQLVALQEAVVQDWAAAEVNISGSKRKKERDRACSIMGARIASAGS